MKTVYLIGLIVFANFVFAVSSAGSIKEIKSPNNKITVKIDISNTISYSVNYNGEKLIVPSPISLNLGFGDVLGHDPKLLGSKVTSVNNIVKPVIKDKRAEILNKYNQLTLSFSGNYKLTFRVFDDGVAYRWETSRPGNITVYSEEANFTFASRQLVYFPQTGGYITAFQQNYKHLPIDSISNKMMSITPTLVVVQNGPRVAITEANLRDYPGMFLRGNSNNTLTGKYAPYILNGEGRVSPKDMIRADYLAKTTGTRTFPWRVLSIVEKDGDLINTQIVYLLGEPSKLDDTSWIKSGKIAWDWYNANRIYNVDFKAGLNYDTYKYYIDFAADHNLEYVVLDEGWSDTYNVMNLNKDMRMDELTKYAIKKGVGLILWVEWSTFDANLEAATKRFQDWGIVGIKMDFMNRDDQYMVKLYERVAIACAKRHLLVDYHGSYKPTGIRRTYPNIMTYEGVVGLENCKWSDNANPKYNVTFPFIRMLAGPADYTPGAMINAQKRNFKPIFYRPMGMGTRCHQLAMYVVFESPLQMLAETPTIYLKEKESLAFLSDVPVEWDETVVLDAKVGEYIVIARKNGDNWYIGAMTNWDKRELTVDLSKLAKGTFTMEEFEDGINAEICGNDYKKTVHEFDTSQKKTIKKASGGGWVAILKGAGK